MTTTKYRVQYAELLNGARIAQDALVPGTLEDVQDHLDRRSWDFDSLVVVEHVGSDSAGRVVPSAEHGLN